LNKHGPSLVAKTISAVAYGLTVIVVFGIPRDPLTFAHIVVFFWFAFPVLFYLSGWFSGIIAKQVLRNSGDPPMSKSYSQIGAAMALLVLPSLSTAVFLSL